MNAADDPLDAARGIANGMCLSVLLWVVALLFVEPVSLLNL